MAISPFRLGTGGRVVRSHPPKDDRLTFSQALTITAGLAGLVGLCSGVFIRFSLANSPSTRFLSPLQTFPALSNWKPEPPTDSVDYQDISGFADANGTEVLEENEWREESEWEEESLADEFDNAPNNEAFEGPLVEEPWSEEPFLSSADDTNVLKSTDSRSETSFETNTFDAFANRSEDGASRQDNEALLKRLERGPQFRQPEDSSLEDRDYSEEDTLEYSEDSNYYERAYDDIEDESPYAEDDYWSDSYSESTDFSEDY